MKFIVEAEVNGKIVEFKADTKFEVEQLAYEIRRDCGTIYQVRKED